MPESTPGFAAAVAALRAGLLVGMPTETVYGLAADATDAEAVIRIFTAKGRPTFDPLIVHVADPEDAWRVAVPSVRARRLAEACWPGPLTLVLPRTALVPDAVTAGLDTVGVRCPAHPLARALIRACGRPLAAPSANPFGFISPTTAAHVAAQLGDRVSVILDGGACTVGIESTVLVPDPQPLILRPGGLTREALEQILGEPVAEADRSARAASLALPAPGLLASHYAPRTPLHLLAEEDPWPVEAHIGRLAFTGPLPPGGPTEFLSAHGDMAEAARTCFAALRRLDASGARTLVAKLLPAVGLGVGLNDRLRRAAGQG